METNPTYNSYEPQNVRMFRNLAEQLTDTYARKNQDYGDSFGLSVAKYGFIAALTRMSDKFNRAENLIIKQDTAPCVEEERLEDTLLDLASYCIMTVIELNKNK